nr:hypothetical protein [Thermococcus sp. P6]
MGFLEIEIRVENGEFHKIRKRKREIQKNFEKLNALEETLRVLQIEMLLEKKRRLERKLEEVRSHYEELLEFSERAKRDRELLIRVRRDISEENRKLREAMRNEDNSET